MKNGILFLFILFIFSTCKKDNEPTPAIVSPVMNWGINFKVDAYPLTTDSILYFNDAGNNYSVKTLRFYLSRISLIKDDDTRILIKDYLYIDAKDISTLNVSFKNLPAGCYKGISFNIGVDSAHNVVDGLPANSNNLAMEWPNVMGGGYHFLMLEGYFTDTSATPGYAMHLGTNSCLIPVVINQQICLTNNNTLLKSLTMNINEWFRNPQNFDFNTDGNYIMGNMMAMQKLAGNGSDVFEMQ